MKLLQSKIPLTDNAFAKYSHYLLISFCLSVSLSIAASQTAAILSLIYWSLFISKNEKSRQELLSKEVLALAVPIICWLICSYCSSFFGIRFAEAFKETLKTTAYLLMPFIVFTSLKIDSKNHARSLVRIKQYLIAIIFSQVLASLHTVTTSAFGTWLSIKPPGSVTESGQLVLVIAASLALYFISQESSKGPRRILYPALSFFTVCVSLLLVWSDKILINLSSEQNYKLFFLALLLTMLVFGCYKAVSCRIKSPSLCLKTNSPQFKTTHAIFFGLLIAALIINLKRGPWFGVGFELIVLGFLVSKRVLFGSLVAILACFLLLSPVRERSYQSAEHFNAVGGRQTMWAIGLQMAERYPLGVGLDNAELMHEIDPTLPASHRHTHNNILNIAVETGWLGLMFYIWWMGTVIFKGAWRFIKHKEESDSVSFVSLSLAVGILAWQIAGIVEYNFGDGEIRMIAFFFMGLILFSNYLLINKNLKEHAS